MCGKMCGKIEKLLDCNKNWCGSRYGPRDYDSGDKKTKKIVVQFVVKCVVKCVVKLKNCQIGTKIGMVVDMDPVIMIVVTKRQNGKKTKKKTKKKEKKDKKGKKDKKDKKGKKDTQKSNTKNTKKNYK